MNKNIQNETVFFNSFKKDITLNLECGSYTGPPPPSRTKSFIALGCKKMFPHIPIINKMSLKFENLSEIDFIL
jgi:hypothetical protein